MSFRKSIFMLLSICLLTVVQHLSANELQRLVFNAAGNIGLAEAVVEFQGITPENSNTLNGYINTAIAMLDQLAGQYNDPPFDAGQIRKIADMLRRFPLATEQMNNRGKASYLKNCYTNLKSAMSTIFRSDFGLKYNSTCDTFVAEIGYYSGQALIASQMGDSFLESMAKSGINQALNAGTRTRNYLGCSFLNEDQARSLNVPNLKTPEDFTQMIRNLENDVRMASLNLEPGFDSPATKGTVIQPIDPPPPADDNQPAIRLVGRWKSTSDSTHINFVQEGTRINGYIYDVSRYKAEHGYRNNEKIIEVIRESDRKYTGSFLYKRPMRDGAMGATWTPVRIELRDNTSGAGRQAYITYTNPDTSIGTHQWYYSREQ